MIEEGVHEAGRRDGSAVAVEAEVVSVGRAGEDRADAGRAAAARATSAEMPSR